MKVAIIGAGKMGLWFTTYLLKKGFEIILADLDEKKLCQIENPLFNDYSKLKQLTTSSSIDAIKNGDVVVLAVPQNALEGLLSEIGQYINRNKLIIDISSIRKTTLSLLRKYLKSGVVLGVHPMFGPGAKDIKGHLFILTPESASERKAGEKVKEYLEANGARTMILSPQKHDEVMSAVLGLSHFIAVVAAHTLLSLDQPEETIEAAGTTYKMLLTFAGAVLSEEADFYGSLQMNLPDAGKIEGLFLEKAKFWQKMIENKETDKFFAEFNKLKLEFGKVSPDFVKSYQRVYKILENE
jgi:prephenate dehydrogenase